MLKKLTISLLVLFTLLACDGDDRCNPQTTYSITGFQATAGTVLLDYGDTTAESFALELTPTSQTESTETASGSIRWSLWPKAYATDCPAPISEEKISYISVTSQSDYDDTHQAGDNLNDLLVSHFGAVPLEEHITGTLSNRSYLYVFTSNPTLDLEHQFEIEIILDTGAQFFISTESATFPAD